MMIARRMIWGSTIITWQISQYSNKTNTEVITYIDSIKDQLDVDNSGTSNYTDITFIYRWLSWIEDIAWGEITLATSEQIKNNIITKFWEWNFDHFKIDNWDIKTGSDIDLLIWWTISEWWTLLENKYQKIVTWSCTTWSSIRIINSDWTVTCETNTLNSVTSAWNTTTNNITVWDITADSFLYSSDRNLKKNIKTINNAIEVVKKLEWVKFDWKNNWKSSYWVIAQDIEKVLPELVHTNETTWLKSVEYANMISVLIEAVKDQQNQIELLNNQLNELKINLSE